MKKLLLSIIAISFVVLVYGQGNYYYEKYGPFDTSIPTPAAFLGYNIGDYHTRHDRIVAYLEKLSEVSDRASIIDYGKSHELRRLVILQISDPQHLSNLEGLQSKHNELTNPGISIDYTTYEDQPVFVNLGYNVHGNEPSSSEAAMLAAYVLVASNHPDIQKFRSGSVVFLDPTINPDGRDRHTQWANSHRSNTLASDPMDSEHNEMWPRGRTNHYWFDLNRDWLLLVHPESQGKLNWYHQWYPNVVTDFHEMGSNSSYFFEPMKTNGSKDPIMPKENYTTLNDVFARYFQRDMDAIGSLYFTKEVFDGTYPGYGSSYPDVQGGLGLLFEQASSRGHVQKTDMGEITFPFTIRNQFINSLGTVEAAVDNKMMLFKYQHDFFKSAITNAQSSGVKAYVFGESYDKTRLDSFIKLLMQHKIKIYPLQEEVYMEGMNYEPGDAFVVPTAQPQYRMVQSMFETYSEYQDSVFYDASAWSLANAYNINYASSRKALPMGDQLTKSFFMRAKKQIADANYAYIIPWDDYNAPAMLYHLLDNKVRVMVSQKPFSNPTLAGERSFSYGALVVPMQKQDQSPEKVRGLLQAGMDEYGIEVFGTNTGFSISGADLGSRYMDALEKPSVVMLIEGGVSSYEAGFVWHLMDQRVHMPITKLRSSLIGRADLDKYNTMVLVSGSYSDLDSTYIAKIKQWVSKGNKLITIGRATQWAIRKKLVNESLLMPEPKKNDEKKMTRYDYVNASEIQGKNSVGGAIFEVDLDITHPLGYGYRDRTLPVYRNNTVWMAPSKSEFGNVAVYTDNPHIDGFITKDNLDNKLKKSVSLISSRVGSGRAILFAEDPNFRGTWYGTNKLFLNAVFFGDVIRIP